MEHCILKIVLDMPLAMSFDYVWRRSPENNIAPAVGMLSLVPFGRREIVGLIVEITAESNLGIEKLKQVIILRHQLTPLSAEWIRFCRFAAEYYQRPLGEVALPGLPKNLRAAKTVGLDRGLKKLEKQTTANNATPHESAQLNGEQQIAVDRIAAAKGFAPILLYGVTGSGKTEVYMQAAAQILARSEREGQSGQVLILVPEINLTPQLEGNVRRRFPDVMVVTLHSGLAEGERTLHWLAAHSGKAGIVLGTRLAILASMPNLKLIIVDEEHDPSYKQQEGLRYSARDLAVWRAHQLGIPIVLGSATPALETWQHAQTNRYKQLSLRTRAVPDAVLPTVQLIDTERDKPSAGLSSTLISAIKRRLERGEQSLLFLNRRGYAPVISCDACGWVSNCPRCTAFMVLHKPEQRLRCHHCSLEQRIPRSCPTCGNVDVQPLGRGTQRIEEGLQGLFPEARVLRIDADSTRLKGSAQAAFETVHRGEVDILIGTQMVAKGHDFQNLTLVGVLNPDTALFSQDYRASERLFAQLMQVAGRAGRAAQKKDGNVSQVMVQTRYPAHPLYGALVANNYDQFATSLLLERQQAGLPPYVHQALMRAEARELADAITFLQDAAASLNIEGIVMNEPIPMTMTRVANIERAQLLVESTSRPALQAFLKEWLAIMRAKKTSVKWSLEVDPVDI